MRPVAFSAAQDPIRDRDAEEIWCANSGKLKLKLAQNGTDLTIEQSRPVGAVPLKRIARPNTAGTTSAEAPTLRERTLR